MNFYNFANIRQLLTTGFNREELNTLCFDFFDLRDFAKNNESLTSKKFFVMELINYSERRGIVNTLLQAAKKENESMYNRYRPYYNLPLAPEIAAEERHVLDNLNRFYNLDATNKTITLYTSRHFAATQLPTINNFSFSHSDYRLPLNTIHDYQQSERQHLEQTTFISEQEYHDPFSVASAIEILEALYLKDEIEKSRLRDLYPEDIVEELLNTDVINVSLSVCPEPHRYEEILNKGTTIFIGGPRANLGTFYHLYGYNSEAATVRPGRLSKNVIECISDPTIFLECDENHNLAIIQKHKISKVGKTVFYLAGTGVNGTAAAVAYIRQYWLSLLNKYKEGNFFVIIKVPGGKLRQENLEGYNPKYWTPDKWTEMELVCECDT